MYDMRRWNGVGPAWELMERWTLRDDDDGDDDAGGGELVCLLAICPEVWLACARLNMVQMKILMQWKSCQSSQCCTDECLFRWKRR
mmetsp:Transcript_22920/g.66153  ORF Transcript_22920/g.66153 Transcript_22920/m.66153 type:complete len:86 (-) Transcript_22920:123-380(-)